MLEYHDARARVLIAGFEHAAIAPFGEGWLRSGSRREVAWGEVDFVGFAIPDVCGVGYGIDYAERYRELPFIGKVSG